MNLLAPLLGFAHAEEDPLTEMLAWFLRTSPVLRRGEIVPVGALVPRAGGSLPTAGPTTTATARDTRLNSSSHLNPSLLKQVESVLS